MNSTTESPSNSKTEYLQAIYLAEAVDAWRIFPRLFIIVYMILVLWASIWFMGLAAPVAAQTGFISTVVGAGAAWFGLYVNSGSKDKAKRTTKTTVVER